MPRPVRAFAVMAAVFLALDFTWLSQTGARLYRPALGPILADRPALAPGVLFYVLYLAGIFVLVVRPAITQGRLFRAAWSGAFFGLVAYGTYDLTNQATLKVWSGTVTLCDLAWGAFATAVAATAGYLAGRSPRDS
jgi:uncharacterized membrane protein